MKIHKEYLLQIINASDGLFEYDETENTVKLLQKKPIKDC
jgi:hypothetical protein